MVQIIRFETHRYQACDGTALGEAHPVSTVVPGRGGAFSPVMAAMAPSRTAKAMTSSIESRDHSDREVGLSWAILVMQKVPRKVVWDARFKI